MNFSIEELLRLTDSSLTGFAAVELNPIEKGGSSRCFYRLHSDKQESVILVHDLGEKEENKHYAALARFLEQHDVPVPGVRAADHARGLLWLEDLGERDLWASRQEPWEVRRPLYQSVLKGIAILHRIPVEEAQELHLQKEFDEHLYRWEQEYFTEHCLGDIFQIPMEQRSVILQSSAMRSLASTLAALPRQLVHRDFQSQNIMICAGAARFIDFQGMRPGLAHYDLASLLCDPYVIITPQERTELLDFYRQLIGDAGIETKESFDRIFWQCSVQRLMQALGAYGFLSIHRGKPAFRSHVAPALKNLREALHHLNLILPTHERLDELASLVAHLKD